MFPSPAGTGPVSPRLSTPRRLPGFDIEQVRVAAEAVLASEIAGHPLFRSLASKIVPSDPLVARRQLLAQALRLTDSMAPAAYAVAREVQRTLSVNGELELYQSAGRENATIHLIESPIVIEIQGRLLPLLDTETLRAVFGHEIGHFLAHGPLNPAGPVHVVALAVGNIPDLPKELESALQTLSVLRELTADRVGLLASQDLDAALRLEMVATTGLAADAITWDTQAYLAQCQELMQGVLDGHAHVYASTHPEHSLRAYALWLYSETVEYQRLTGKGNASRSLHEVEETLQRLVVSPQLSLDGGCHILDDPPRELHECALAASVVVAHADGVVSDEEVEVIENVFAPLVADWRSYLEMDVATQQLRSTGPIVAACGSDLLHSLFNLLVHVMGADGTMDESEVAAIQDIGGILGCADEYTRRLRTTLTSLKLSLHVAEPAPPPLAAPRREVSDAFEVFLSGVHRRGESVTTLRRILRLLGISRRTPESLGQITQMLGRSKILADSDLLELGLDDRLRLTSPTATREDAAGPIASQVAPSRQNLILALTRLREQLVSGDGRSPSVRIRKIRKGKSFDLYGLERVAVGRAERVLVAIRNAQKTVLVSPEESGKHPEAKKSATDLLALDRAHRSRLEETGGHDLYLGHPIVVGNVSAKKGAGYLVRGPLILHSVELERQGKGAPGYKLAPRKDYPPIVNQSLLRLVFNKSGLEYSDAVSDELDQLVADPKADANALLNQLGKYGLRVSRGDSALLPLRDRDDEFASRGVFLETEECALLGIFPQSNSDLLQDYDGLLKDLADPSLKTADAMAAAQRLLPEGLRDPVEHNERPSAPALPSQPVVLADPIQRKVIADCRSNRATVVDGPPGTGKSQVIVNLVANALRRGESVAVVCEKRAALDVVHQRLEALGLRHTIGLVHDVNEDRRPLYSQIASRMEGFSPQPFDETLATQKETEHRKVVEALDLRSRTLEKIVGHSELSTGQLHTLLAGIAQPHLPKCPSLEKVSKQQLVMLLEHVTALHPLQAVWAESSPLRSPDPQKPRSSFASFSPAQVGAFGDGLPAAIERAGQLESLIQASPVGTEAVARAQPAFEAVVVSRNLRSSLNDAERFRQLLQIAESAPHALQAAPATLQLFQGSEDAITRFEHPVEIPTTPLFLQSVKTLQLWARRWLRVLAWPWWKARSLVRQELLTSWPSRATEPLTVEFTQELFHRVIASDAWSRLRASFGELGLGNTLPTTSAQLRPFLLQTSAQAQAAGTLARSRPLLEEASAWLGDGDPSTTLAQWDSTVEERLQLLKAAEALDASTGPILEAFPWLPARPGAADLTTLRTGWLQCADRLVETDRLFSAARSCFTEIVPLLDTLVREEPEAGADRWRALITAAWAHSHLEAASANCEATALLGSIEDHKAERAAASQLGEVETELSELEVERILAQADQAKMLKIPPAGKGQRRTPDQKFREEILKEAGKQRKVLPLRSFARRYAAAGLLDLVPVWLLSPETIAILFPRQPLFDLVIFDEASQCTVEAGLPVLLRARRVVVAGDEKQMPPSAYFASSSGSEEEFDEETEDQDARELKDMLAAESLLTLARSRIPHSGLTWHYRCKDESLIAFSNHSMYHGELLTIPAKAGPSAPSVMRWVQSPGGSYDKGANEPEAESVVDEVHALLRRSPTPSIGVITFNLRQRRTILDAIDSRCEKNQEFRSLWQEASDNASVDERPFVKNLENVQGDERDIIVFSLGHAPQERTRKGVGTGEYYVPARFGPLGKRGGERRLNVAISRAKSECCVVASFLPTQLSVASAKHAGPKLFKDFLEFVHHLSDGRRTRADRVLDLVREERVSPHHRISRTPLEAYTPLVVQIFDALEKLGVPTQLNVGSSEFRIPLAIHDPVDPHQFKLAILPEEGHGDEAITPFERHVHRPAVLGTRGWSVMRITAASWQKRREDILQEIFQRVPGAQGALQSDRWRAHRAKQVAQAAAPPPSFPAQRPRTAPKAGEAQASTRAEAATEVAASPVAIEEVLPEWLSSIENPRFRKALLHLQQHGQLNETELINLVGGPRLARSFGRELDTWADGMPFKVQVQQLAGSKVYRNVGGS